ncbi:hypothetical protein DXG03_006946 [Asterophora parasitica]|uniref:Peptidase S1 domain-containing protein n=1 Tax=Asterophora parasitica TaxID=117018 RepID=A0A9P7K958_9AGAR|nr:hypothetical protein DXG03_006946 [Asterophora parasitica]
MQHGEKIVSLSNDELGALGYLGSNALQPVIEMVHAIQRIPNRLDWLTVGQLECLHLQTKYHPGTVDPPPPISPTISIDSTASSVSSTMPDEPGLVGPREKAFFLTGISSPEHPHLLHRSDVDSRPWTIPEGRHTAIPSKSLHGASHPILNNNHWKHTIAPDVLLLVNAPGSGIKVTSMIPLRFSTASPPDGPRVLDEHTTLLISVRRGSMAETTCRDANDAIISIFARHGVDGIAVCWIEGDLERLVGTPSMMKVVGDTDPTAYIRRCMTAVLGASLAPKEQEEQDGQGTLGLYFHVLKDKKGEQVHHVYGITNKHVVSRDIHADYEFSGRPGDPKKHIGNCGKRRLQQVMDETRFFIAKKLGEAKLFAEQIATMEAEPTPNDLDEAEEAEEAITRKVQDLERVKKDVGKLEAFLSTLKGSWSDSLQRIIGFLDWAPRIKNNVDSRRYTRDMAVFELEREKFKKNFKGNFMYMAGKFESDEITSIFYPNVADASAFKYPSNHLFKVDGWLTAAQLANPHFLDERGNPGYVAAKFGQKTDLTFAQYSELEAYTCNDLEGSSWECAFFNLAGHQNFSAKGDSGAAIVNAEGKLIAFLHSGMPWGLSSHVTFGTPAHFVIDQIKTRYPNAIFGLTAF